MIRKSFIFLERIGKKKEQNIWQQDIEDWQDFLQISNVKGISSSKKSYYERKIGEAQEALLDDNSAYFIGKLPKVQIWRLYNYFKSDCCYLDIEINSQGKIILVGISDYYSTNIFVKGVNLYKSLIEIELKKYKIVITFNGGAFDLPKLKKELKVNVNIPHIDLKPLCVNLGLKGGLKEVEKILDLRRPSHLYGNPIDLWQAFHASGDREYLNLLIDYNKEDIENLRGVMEHCYGKLREKCLIIN